MDDLWVAGIHQELDSLSHTGGLTMSDVLALPDRLRRLIRWMIRANGAGFGDIAAHGGVGEDAVRPVVARLMEKGMLEEEREGGRPVYRVSLIPPRKRGATRDLWSLLDE